MSQHKIKLSDVPEHYFCSNCGSKISSCVYMFLVKLCKGNRVSPTCVLLS